MADEESIEDFVARLAGGERRALARALSRAESHHATDRLWLDALWKHVGESAAASLRVAITGAPGVGKSSLIERVGVAEIEAGHRVAVLPIDPSSRVSGGSLLADKTRMAELSRHPGAFVRPSAAGRMLGGLALNVLESIELCELAGYDRVFVETVGVGQSEADAALVTDAVVLVVAPGAGDELQALKRGLNEVCDLVLVNKADGERLLEARRVAGQYEAAFGLCHGKKPEVMQISASEGTGIADFCQWLSRRGAEATAAERNQVRRLQRRAFFERVLANALVEAISAGRFEADYATVVQQVERGELRAPRAAQLVVERLLSRS